MPMDILIYAIIAAVMVFWLRNVIGTRNGSERQRPNPFEEKKPSEDAGSSLPPVDMKPVRDIEQIKYKATSVGEKADAGLVQIALADKTFDVHDFRENASDAFGIIVHAFAEGDRDTLRDLCSKDVYNAFDGALKEREAKGEKVSTEIHSIRKNDIVDAGIIDRKTAYVTIRFTADETYVIENAKGNIIAGHPDRVTEMTDKWTFSRSLKSADPRWFLSKTEDDVVEVDGKTPLPDAG